MVGVWLVMQQRRGEQETGGAVWVVCVVLSDGRSLSTVLLLSSLPRKHISLDLSRSLAW